MTQLTKEAMTLLDNAEEMTFAISKEGEGDQPMTHQGMAANAIVDAIRALCYEIAALREASSSNMADIESTLHSKLK